MITVDFARLNIRPGDRILDVGCGSGRHICAASRLKGVVVVGSDKNSRVTLEAKRRMTNEQALGVQGGGEWGVVVCDIRCLPFKENHFDLIICSEVLEHVKDQDTAIEEVARVLKSGRDLVVSVPRYLPERVCWALSEAYYRAEDGHVRIYRAAELTWRLQKAGLIKWANHFAHALHTPYWWLKCLIGPEREDSPIVRHYHNFLVWDMMKHPRITRALERLLNPLFGKSVVIYLRKGKHVQDYEFT